MAQEGRGWEVREEATGGGARITVAPEGVETLPEPTNMGPIPVDYVLAMKLLATVAWRAHGDREASECVPHVYLDEIEQTMKTLDFRFEHFMHGDGSEEQGGQGIRIVMTPKEGVGPEDLPETELGEDD